MNFRNCLLWMPRWIMMMKQRCLILTWLLNKLLSYLKNKMKHQAIKHQPPRMLELPLLKVSHPSQSKWLMMSALASHLIHPPRISLRSRPSMKDTLTRLLKPSLSLEKRELLPRLPSRVPLRSRSKLISALRPSSGRLKRPLVKLLILMSRHKKLKPRPLSRPSPEASSRSNKMSPLKPRLGSKLLYKSTRSGGHTLTSERTLESLPKTFIKSNKT